ncbi:hypothetical protein B0T11DRAFT_116772 [Plectosphaerella cucumerina]|uniref:Uncharacterized protein n=1 Tax=Plectosphaerella cucumerina TaxID=40658 RepID=A0A8K0X175_9PEZI|nr:hypothetical protein B0T11DRAFT_116772 [Plectosphaerella cucumerina]
MEGADNSCVPISAENLHIAIVEDVGNCPSEGMSCSQGFSCARVPSAGGVDSFACFPTASLRAPTQCDSTNFPSGICYDNICRELESSPSICITNKEIPLPLLRRQAIACPTGFDCVDMASQKAGTPSTVGNTHSPPRSTTASRVLLELAAQSFHVSASVMKFSRTLLLSPASLRTLSQLHRNEPGRVRRTALAASATNNVYRSPEVGETCIFHTELTFSRHWIVTSVISVGQNL